MTIVTLDSITQETLKILFFYKHICYNLKRVYDRKIINILNLEPILKNLNLKIKFKNKLSNKSLFYLKIKFFKNFKMLTIFLKLVL